MSESPKKKKRVESPLDAYVYYGQGNVPKDITAVVSISSEVTEIPSNAFRGCKSLQDVCLNQNLNATQPLRAPKLKQIGECAFQECTSLSRVVLGPTVQSLGKSAFFCCMRLQQIELNDQIVEIPEHCFAGCMVLQRLRLERATSLQVIGKDAFSFCSLLERVQFPPNLKEIRSWAFEHCEKLRSVDFSQATQLDLIGYSAFKGSDLITVDLTGTFVKVIKFNCFSDCRSLSQVRLSDELVRINAWAFSGCSSLEDVRFPDKLETIGHDAFLDCDALVHVTLPSSITFCWSTPFDPRHIESIIYEGNDLRLMVELSLLYSHAISMDRMIFLNSFQPKLLNESWGQEKKEKMKEIQVAYTDAIRRIVVWCVGRGMFFCR